MRSQDARKKLSATDLRSLRTLLLMSVFDRKAIGERIQKARNEMVLSESGGALYQEDLARLLGVGTRTVQNYEAGSTDVLPKLKQIAGILGRPVEWFLYGDPDPPPEPTGLSGQAIVLVLDRLESLEDKFEEHGRLTVYSLERLREGIEQLTRRLDDEDHREQTP